MQRKARQGKAGQSKAKQSKTQTPSHVAPQSIQESKAYNRGGAGFIFALQLFALQRCVELSCFQSSSSLGLRVCGGSGLGRFREVEAESGRLRDV